MHALLAGRENVSAPNLRAWLRHGEPALERLQLDTDGLAPVNLLSQLNVLQQIEHLRSYPVVKDRIAEGRLKLHGWWFELSTAGVYAFDESAGTYILIDEAEAERTLNAPSTAWRTVKKPETV
jgi:carbonic anhydrase